jgi:hypothetical protein
MVYYQGSTPEKKPNTQTAFLYYNNSILSSIKDKISHLSKNARV